MHLQCSDRKHILRRSNAISVCVCLYMSAGISQQRHINSRDIQYMLPVAVARSSSVLSPPLHDVNGIRYVLPVLCMTSCFHVMGRYMARGVGNNDVGAALKQSSQNFQRIYQGATLFYFVLV